MGHNCNRYRVTSSRTNDIGTISWPRSACVRTSVEPIVTNHVFLVEMINYFDNAIGIIRLWCFHKQYRSPTEPIRGTKTGIDRVNNKRPNDRQADRAHRSVGGLPISKIPADQSEGGS